MRWLSAVAGSGQTLAEQAASAYAALPAGTVHVTEYVATRAVDDVNVLGAARPGNVAVSTVVVPGFIDADQLVAIEPHVTDGADDTDGVVFLPTVLPDDTSGDLFAQTEQVFAKTAELLAELRLSMANVVLTVDHTTAATRRDYPRTGKVRRQQLSSPYPGAAGILQDRMLADDALIALDVVASRHELVGVNPGWARYDKLTYLPAVAAGPILFLAGQGALDVETEEAVHAGDIAAQTDYTYRNIVRVLEADGLGPDALVHVTEYVTPEGLPRVGEIDAARDAVLGGHRPETTRILCAGLLRPEFEIEVIPLARRA